MSRGRIIRGPRGHGGQLPEAPTARVIRSAEQRATLRAEARLSEAEARLAEAERAAGALLEQARIDARRLQQEALDEGRAEAAKVLLGAQEAAHHQLAGAEDELTALAVDIAERLLDRELALAPDAIAAVVARALEAARGCQQAVIRVNPEDRANLEPMLAEQGAAGRLTLADARLTLQADPAIRRGGCVIETDAGQVDGRLEPQLAAIRATLRAGALPAADRTAQKRHR